MSKEKVMETFDGETGWGRHEGWFPVTRNRWEWNRWKAGEDHNESSQRDKRGNSPLWRGRKRFLTGGFKPGNQKG